MASSLEISTSSYRESRGRHFKPNPEGPEQIPVPMTVIVGTDRFSVEAKKNAGKVLIFIAARAGSTVDFPDPVNQHAITTL